jgi:hypothetical protein
MLPWLPQHRRPPSIFLPTTHRRVIWFCHVANASIGGNPTQSNPTQPIVGFLEQTAIIITASVVCVLIGSIHSTFVTDGSMVDIQSQASLMALLTLDQEVSLVRSHRFSLAMCSYFLVRESTRKCLSAVITQVRYGPIISLLSPTYREYAGHQFILLRPIWCLPVTWSFVRNFTPK